MPVRKELLPLYGPDWPAISQRIRFDRAGGRCEACGRPHGALIITTPNGGWIDPATGEAWLPGGRAAAFRGTTRVFLATAHLDHNPANNDDSNLKALCQRCHMVNDLWQHVRQRRLNLRSGWAVADLFEIADRAESEEPSSMHLAGLASDGGKPNRHVDTSTCEVDEPKQFPSPTPCADSGCPAPEKSMRS